MSGTRVSGCQALTAGAVLVRNTPSHPPPYPQPLQTAPLIESKPLAACIRTNSYPVPPYFHSIPLQVWNSYAEVRDSAIVDNQSRDFGGGVFVEGALEWQEPVQRSFEPPLPSLRCLRVSVCAMMWKRAIM